jgi:uncharacterized membrane protein HdeD (DUF308 family)
MKRKKLIKLGFFYLPAIHNLYLCIALVFYFFDKTLILNATFYIGIIASLMIYGVYILNDDIKPCKWNWMMAHNTLSVALMGQFNAFCDYYSWLPTLSAEFVLWYWVISCAITILLIFINYLRCRKNAKLWKYTKRIL